MTVLRSAAALTMVLGFGATAFTGSQAQATAANAGTTAAACTKYVVISPQPVEIWMDSEPVTNHHWYKLSLGQVFCAYEANASNTRFRVDYNCHPLQGCDPAGPRVGWVTNSQFQVMPLNCTARTLTRLATVYTVTAGDEAWMDWPSGTSFCAYGSNAGGTRYQVYIYCNVPLCARTEGVFVGWVTSDPTYYAATSPAVPSGLSAMATSATSIRLQWTDNSSNEEGFEVINGATSRLVGANTTSYTWNVAAGTYMCFKIRAYNTSGYSAFHPSAQMDWACVTTPTA